MSDPATTARCGCPKDAPANPLGLSCKLRLHRLAAGVICGLVAALFLLSSGNAALIEGLLLGWLSLWHLVAAAIGYRGCPELGLPLSLLKRRMVFVHGVWCRHDRHSLQQG